MKPIDELCIHTMRILSAEAIQKANSGHPGMPMGAASMAYVLWARFLKHNPKKPHWPDRDRFILSAGHGSMLLYSLLHLTGYGLSLEEIKNFRQLGSRTAGHPEYGLTPGVEMTTGPLGQGMAHAVGMAMAERYLAQQFNRPGHTIVDHFTYTLVGDGDLMEGLSQEVVSFAGHLRLGKLICLFDDNRITTEGSTSLTTSDDVAARFRASRWHVQSVASEDLDGIAQAIEAARTTWDAPSLIAVRTHIAHGSPNKQDKCGAHGAPLGEDELALTKEALGWTATEPFHVPQEVREHMHRAIDAGEAAETEWNQAMERYASEYPRERVRWDEWLSGSLPEELQHALLTAGPATDPMATRVASGKALNAAVPVLDNLVGGSADLNGSTGVVIKNAGVYTPGEAAGPNIYFGIREHVMAAAVNGMALHGGLRPFCATFLVFSDYLRPALRLAAMMQLPSIYIFSHDSIGLGEDGPTHQPVEHLPSLRAIPGLTIIRPADARETFEAWDVALRNPGPTALILSRQKVAPLSRDRVAATAYDDPSGGGPTGLGTTAVARGAYVLSEAGIARSRAPEVILIATGAEVGLCIQAQGALEDQGIATRVVSMPSWELFERQPEAYREAVLPPQVTKRVVVEAAIPLGWERYAGPEGVCLGMNGFGVSAPSAALFEKYGFTAERITEEAARLLDI